MKKIVLFGDSITAGYEDGFIHPTLTALIQAFSKNWSIVNAGVPGFTTQDALSIFDRHVLGENPDQVVIFFGANDVADHHYVPIEDYKANLVHYIEAVSPGKTILVTPPYCDQTLQTDRPIERIHAYADVVKELGKAYQISVIDLLLHMEQNYPAINYFQADGLHFNKNGYTLLSDLYNSALEKKIGK